MKRLFVAVLLGIGLTMMSIANLHGQISVGLHVTEDTGGVFYSNFASAFRALGDVQVVGQADNPSVVVVVVVVCGEADCADTDEYAVSISVLKPIAASAVAVEIQKVSDAFPTVLTYEDIEVVARNLQYFRSTEMGWASLWGRQRYERAIREVVASIDTDCLETLRIGQRRLAAARSGDMESATRLGEQMLPRKCF